MKKIFSFLIVAFTASKLNAQQIPATGSCQVNNTMSAYHGTWQWVNGTDTVRFYLAQKKVYININGGYHKDLLIGWHIYKRGNAVIESSYPNINIVNRKIFLGSNVDEPPGVATGTLKDLSKNKCCELSLTLDPTNTQMTWKSERTPGIRLRVSGDPQHQPGFTLPENTVLIKQ